jgi:maspardin
VTQNKISTKPTTAMNKNFLLTGLATTIVNLLLNAVAYFIFLKDFFASHPAGSEEFMKQLNRDQLIGWAMVVTSLTMGFFITTVIKWSGATTFVSGLKNGLITGVLFWSSVNFGLYASSNHFSQASVFVDTVCSATAMTISAGVAAWMLGRGRKKKMTDELKQGTTIPNKFIQESNSFLKEYPIKKVSINTLKEWNYIDTETKNKPVLLMLHGTRGNPYVFWNQFNQLKSDFRLISVKLPLSHNAKLMCNELSQLMEKFSISKFSLLGTSLGGYLAQWFAYYYPQKINRLFICNSIINGENINNPSLFLSRYILPLIPYSFILKKFQKEMNKSDGFYQELNAYVYQNILVGLSSIELAERALMFHFNKEVPKSKLNESEITIIDCQDDPFIPDCARNELISRYPNAFHYQFNKGHHFPYILDPQKFNSLILKRTSYEEVKNIVMHSN